MCLKGSGDISSRNQKNRNGVTMPSSCQYILSEPVSLLGGWVQLLILFFHLLNIGTMVSREDTQAYTAVDQSQLGKKNIE